jgi:RND family efflux transporter MFP subunit
MLTGCNQTPASPEKKTPEVIVTTPIRSEVTDYREFTGRLDALIMVEIRARVSGFVTAVPFKEGDLVHKGDLLFEIDRRPYQANLNQSEANLKLAEADRNLQEKNATRARLMISNRSIGREEYDQILATFEKSKATVEAMKAARDLNQIYLDYTQVVAPFDGRVSRRNVDPGNLVNADNTVLTTVVTENPVYAYFDVDERTYLDLMESAPKDVSWFKGLQFPVLMRQANEENFSRSGTVNFIDNRVIGTTGTIRMRGVFDNADGILKPGLFARIRLPIGSPYKALLITDEALMSDQGRKYVYTVDDENEVVYRPITLGQEIHGLRVIKEGLKEGERVVISGMQRVKPKSKVQVEMQKPPKPPDSPLSKLLTSVLNRQGDKEAAKKQGAHRQGEREVLRPGAALLQHGD